MQKFDLLSTSGRQVVQFVAGKTVFFSPVEESGSAFSDYQFIAGVVSSISVNNDELILELKDVRASVPLQEFAYARSIAKVVIKVHLDNIEAVDDYYRYTIDPDGQFIRLWDLSQKDSAVRVQAL